MSKKIALVISEINEETDKLFAHSLPLKFSRSLNFDFPPLSPDVLKYQIDAAGFLAAFPYLLMACIVQSAGFLADMARTKGRLSTTQVHYTKE